MHTKFAFTETSTELRTESRELWLIWKSVFTLLGRPIHKRIFIAFSHIHNTLINYFQHFRGVRGTRILLAVICRDARSDPLAFRQLSRLGDEMMTFICLGSWSLVTGRWSLSICVLLPVPSSWLVSYLVS